MMMWVVSLHMQANVFYDRPNRYAFHWYESLWNTFWKCMLLNRCISGILGCNTTDWMNDAREISRVCQHIGHFLLVGSCFHSKDDIWFYRLKSACVITWLCTDSPLQDGCIVLLIPSKHFTHSNTGTITVTESSCTHSFPHNDPMHGFADECVQYYSPPQSCAPV